MSRPQLDFVKPGTNYTEQLDRLVSRGMIVGDYKAATHWLRTVGYYRLGVYWLPFEKPPQPGQTRSKTFKARTSFEDIIDLYIFDRKLRLIVTEAIERNEIALRAGWTYQMSNRHGSHAYLNPELFSWGLGYAERIAAIEDRVRNSSEMFVQHYLKKYKQPYLPPL